jgi:hypothetical protein
VLATTKNFKKGVVLSDTISMVDWMADYKMDDMTEKLL